MEHIRGSRDVGLRKGDFMREIRFRAWDKKYKEMLSPEYLWKCTFYLCPCNGTFNAYGVDPDAPDDRDKEGMGENENLIPMQYTGLKDKNGNEIYEGDIYTSSMSKSREVKWKQEWDDCECSYAGWSFNVINPKYIEIIGNIYETPELLKIK